MNIEQKNFKKLIEYNCEDCQFITSRKNDYNRHMTTQKHLSRVKTNKIKRERLDEIHTFSCEYCEKYYKSKSGLWSHSKKCAPSMEFCATIKVEDKFNQIENALTASTLSMSGLMKQNQEFKELIIEQNKKIMELATEAKTINNTQNNNNNNTNNFNLNFFLNETCKDAMNIKEFIENIKIQMKELENVANNGYVTGITDIILSRLKELDVSKRPVHCTDLKREVLYIREENEWNKDSEDKSNIKSMINKIANLNYKKIPEWRIENPECKEPDNYKYNFCIKMMRNSLGELEEEQDRLDNKIIKSISKQVFVDKNGKN